MTVTLQPISLRNWLGCLRLQVHPAQRDYIAPNHVSLIQASHPHAIARAIYHDHTLVGYVMVGHFKYQAHRRWFISRILVDKRYQRQGYGRKALELVIAFLYHHHNARAVWMSYTPENAIMLKLASRLGFEPVGEASYGEVMVRLRLEPDLTL